MLDQRRTPDGVGPDGTRGSVTCEPSRIAAALLSVWLVTVANVSRGSTGPSQGTAPAEQRTDANSQATNPREAREHQAPTGSADDPEQTSPPQTLMGEPESQFALPEEGADLEELPDDLDEGPHSDETPYDGE